MKVLTVNSSPQMEKGNTALIMNPFLEGMKNAGAEVEVLYTARLNIKPCSGDYGCWIKTPGECIHDDDMADIVPKVSKADILVFATPVYVDGVTSQLKCFMDRLITTGLPFIEIRDDHCRHPSREGGCTDGKFVLISTCGFWELDNFDPMIVHMKAFCRNTNREFSGAILRPHAGSMRPMMEMGFAMDEIFSAARDLGQELVSKGTMSEDKLKLVSKELVPRDMYVDFANQAFQDALKKLGHG